MAKFKDFSFTVGDDGDHERLTAEIDYQQTFVAMLTQEDGFENLKLELFSPDNPDVAIHSFPLQDFLMAIDLAKNKLTQVSGITPFGDDVPM
ncbi:hypothetical protein [Chitinimonas taiwanensis]|uniref:Uncharacterized protein n=2 Tax=Chitinimonas TaxID=240411 RepID=A0A1K2HAN6_9NEIS|nr:hypothetical protein SAMN02745887_00782 [Chitinimonas taiwanensis DSM 18899]